MSNKREVVALSAVRTAIGGYGGSLKSVGPNELAATVIKEAVSRAGVAPEQVGMCVVGNTIPTESRFPYIPRVAAMEGGLSKECSSYGVSRLCGSGMQAIIDAAQGILLGQFDVAIGAGVESMSNGIYGLPTTRWGQRMGNGEILDMMVGVLTDPFGNGHMGITAENIAAKYGITREDQDQLAYESHMKASKAQKEGRFVDQIVPVEVKSRKGVTVFDTDEHIRHDVTVEKLAAMRPAFKKDGSITAGNASGINDAASAIVLMDAEAAAAQGLKPMARLVGYSHAGLEPETMGMGPVPATEKLLASTGLTLDDIDVYEVNEAFAAQALGVCRALNLPMDKVNVNGSGISLGHPVGATANLICVKAIHELHRTQSRYALATLCIGGGQGLASIWERM